MFLWEHLVANTSWGLPSALSALAGVPGMNIELAQRGLALIGFALLLPNVLRTACLYFVSSNMHYYGGIDSRNVHQQTQVMDSWWLAPLQLFLLQFRRDPYAAPLPGQAGATAPRKMS